ncbi:hypothetical protein [Chitinimonas sp. BJB300]|uniref:hypothetical protein n=1 Tax=Chitinimonas sp. BJB300 TaxID=1559339 RepID=UPI000C0DDC2D|nr:hypothetical protein [Chitinimonas sp. BJB300]PHV10198.1 hypothetical protein CSQ89_17535 [Chitinimonas sp. BJB300]TSJ84563.1 hypothetical protein FG002_019725 [Chitinimonas sp. BJB300]
MREVEREMPVVDTDNTEHILLEVTTMVTQKPDNGPAVERPSSQRFMIVKGEMLKKLGPKLFEGLETGERYTLLKVV